MEFITEWYVESRFIFIYSTHTIIKRSITEFLQMHFSIKKLNDDEDDDICNLYYSSNIIIAFQEGD
jgi:hypothetical protein